MKKIIFFSCILLLSSTLSSSEAPLNTSKDSALEHFQEMEIDSEYVDVNATGQTPDLEAAAIVVPDRLTPNLAQASFISTAYIDEDSRSSLQEAKSQNLSVEDSHTALRNLSASVIKYGSQIDELLRSKEALQLRVNELESHKKQSNSQVCDARIEALEEALVSNKQQIDLIQMKLDEQISCFRYLKANVSRKCLPFCAKLSRLFSACKKTAKEKDPEDQV